MSGILYAPLRGPLCWVFLPGRLSKGHLTSNTVLNSIAVEGLEGLIHISELSWTKKNIHPGKVLSTSQKVTVQILEKNLEKRRLSLSYKNTLINPWVKFTKEHKVNDVFEGVVKNITDYALFISIKDSELDGMIHYKDLSWSEKDTELQKYKKKQIVMSLIHI